MSSMITKILTDKLNKNKLVLFMQDRVLVVFKHELQSAAELFGSMCRLIVDGYTQTSLQAEIASLKQLLNLSDVYDARLLAQQKNHQQWVQNRFSRSVALASFGSLIVLNLTLPMAYAVTAGGAYAPTTSGSSSSGSTLVITPNAVSGGVSRNTYTDFDIVNDNTTIINATGFGNTPILNIVTAGGASSINGRLYGRLGSTAGSATGGNIYVINPQGVTFGATAQVDATRFTVATAEPTFSGNDITFTNLPDTKTISISSGATIQAVEKLMMTADNISNSGTLSTSAGGTISLAAAGGGANSVTFDAITGDITSITGDDLSNVTNTGAGGIINPGSGGKVYIKSSGDVINSTSAVIGAASSGATTGTASLISITATKSGVGVNNSAYIVANELVADGGSIEIIAKGSATTVLNTGQIKADNRTIVVKRSDSGDLIVRSGAGNQWGGTNSTIQLGNADGSVTTNNLSVGDTDTDSWTVNGNLSAEAINTLNIKAYGMTGTGARNFTTTVGDIVLNHVNPTTNVTLSGDGNITLTSAANITSSSDTTFSTTGDITVNAAGNITGSNIFALTSTGGAASSVSVATPGQILASNLNLTDASGQINLTVGSVAGGFTIGDIASAKLAGTVNGSNIVQDYDSDTDMDLVFHIPTTLQIGSINTSAMTSATGDALDKLVLISDTGNVGIRDTSTVVAKQALVTASAGSIGFAGANNNITLTTNAGDLTLNAANNIALDSVFTLNTTGGGNISLTTGGNITSNLSATNANINSSGDLTLTTTGKLETWINLTANNLLTLNITDTSALSAKSMTTSQIAGSLSGNAIVRNFDADGDNDVVIQSTGSSRFQTINSTAWTDSVGTALDTLVLYSTGGDVTFANTGAITAKSITLRSDGGYLGHTAYSDTFTLTSTVEDIRLLQTDATKSIILGRATINSARDTLLTSAASITLQGGTAAGEQTLITSARDNYLTAQNNIYGGVYLGGINFNTLLTAGAAGTNGTNYLVTTTGALDAQLMNLVANTTDGGNSFSIASASGGFIIGDMTGKRIGGTIGGVNMVQDYDSDTFNDLLFQTSGTLMLGGLDITNMTDLAGGSLTTLVLHGTGSNNVGVHNIGTYSLTAQNILIESTSGNIGATSFADEFNLTSTLGDIRLITHGGNITLGTDPNNDFAQNTLSAKRDIVFNATGDVSLSEYTLTTVAQAGRDILITATGTVYGNQGVNTLTSNRDMTFTLGQTINAYQTNVTTDAAAGILTINTTSSAWGFEIGDVSTKKIGGTLGANTLIRDFDANGLNDLVFQSSGQIRLGTINLTSMTDTSNNALDALIVKGTGSANVGITDARTATAKSIQLITDTGNIGYAGTTGFILSSTVGDITFFTTPSTGADVNLVGASMTSAANIVASIADTLTSNSGTTFNAANHISMSAGNMQLGVNNITATSGNMTLTSTAGDINLGPTGNATWTASAGNITLTSANDFIYAPTAGVVTDIIAPGGNITINAGNSILGNTLGTINLSALGAFKQITLNADNMININTMNLATNTASGLNLVKAAQDAGVNPNASTFNYSIGNMTGHRLDLFLGLTSQIYDYLNEDGRKDMVVTVGGNMQFGSIDMAAFTDENGVPLSKFVLYSNNGGTITINDNATISGEGVVIKSTGGAMNMGTNSFIYSTLNDIRFETPNPLNITSGSTLDSARDIIFTSDQGVNITGGTYIADRDIIANPATNYSLTTTNGTYTAARYIDFNVLGTGNYTASGGTLTGTSGVYLDVSGNLSVTGTSYISTTADVQLTIGGTTTLAQGTLNAFDELIINATGDYTSGIANDNVNTMNLLSTNTIAITGQNSINIIGRSLYTAANDLTVTAQNNIIGDSGAAAFSILTSTAGDIRLVTNTGYVNAYQLSLTTNTTDGMIDFSIASNSQFSIQNLTSKKIDGTMGGLDITRDWDGVGNDDLVFTTTTGTLQLGSIDLWTLPMTDSAGTTLDRLVLESTTGGSIGVHSGATIRANTITLTSAGGNIGIDNAGTNIGQSFNAYSKDAGTGDITIEATSAAGASVGRVYLGSAGLTAITDVNLFAERGFQRTGGTVTATDEIFVTLGANGTEGADFTNTSFIATTGQNWQLNNKTGVFKYSYISTPVFESNLLQTHGAGPDKDLVFDFTGVMDLGSINVTSMLDSSGNEIRDILVNYSTNINATAFGRTLTGESIYYNVAAGAPTLTFLYSNLISTVGNIEINSGAILSRYSATSNLSSAQDIIINNTVAGGANTFDMYYDTTYFTSRLYMYATRDTTINTGSITNSASGSNRLYTYAGRNLSVNSASNINLSTTRWYIGATTGDATITATANVDAIYNLYNQSAIGNFTLQSLTGAVNSAWLNLNQGYTVNTANVLASTGISAGSLVLANTLNATVSTTTGSIMDATNGGYYLGGAVTNTATMNANNGYITYRGALTTGGNIDFTAKDYINMNPTSGFASLTSTGGNITLTQTNNSSLTTMGIHLTKANLSANNITIDAASRNATNAVSLGTGYSIIAGGGAGGTTTITNWDFQGNPTLNSAVSNGMIVINTGAGGNLSNLGTISARGAGDSLVLEYNAGFTGDVDLTGATITAGGTGGGQLFINGYEYGVDSAPFDAMMSDDGTLQTGVAGALGAITIRTQAGTGFNIIGTGATLNGTSATLESDAGVTLSANFNNNSADSLIHLTANTASSITDTTGTMYVGTMSVAAGNLSLTTQNGSIQKYGTTTSSITVANGGLDITATQGSSSAVYINSITMNITGGDVNLTTIGGTGTSRIYSNILTLNNGNLTANSSTTNQYAYIGNNTFNVTTGNINLTTTSNNYYTEIYFNTMTVTDGNINLTTNNSGAYWSDIYYNPTTLTNGDLTFLMNGGTGQTYVYNPSTTITNGNVTATINGGNTSNYFQFIGSVADSVGKNTFTVGGNLYQIYISDSLGDLGINTLTATTYANLYTSTGATGGSIIDVNDDDAANVILTGATTYLSTLGKGIGEVGDTLEVSMAGTSTVNSISMANDIHLAFLGNMTLTNQVRSTTGDVELRTIGGSLTINNSTNVIKADVGDITLNAGGDLILGTGIGTGISAIAGVVTLQSSGNLLGPASTTTLSLVDDIVINTGGYIDAINLNLTPQTDTTGTISITAGDFSQFRLRNIVGTSLGGNIISGGNIDITVTGDNVGYNELVLGNIDLSTMAGASGIHLSSNNGGDIVLNSGSTLKASHITISGSGGTPGSGLEAGIQLDNINLIATAGDINISTTADGLGSPILTYQGNMTATGNISLSATNGIISLDTVGAASTLAAQDVLLYASHSAGSQINIVNSGTTITALGLSSGSLSFDDDGGTGDPLLTAGNYYVGITSGNIVVDGNITNAGTMEAKAGGGDITVTYSNGDLDLSNVALVTGANSGGTVTQTFGTWSGNAGIEESGSGTGSITLTTTNPLYSIISSGNTVLGADNIVINSAKDISITGEFNGALAGSAVGNITLVSTANNVELGNALLANLTATGGSISITTAAGSITDALNNTTNKLVADGTITLTAGGATSTIGEATDALELHSTTNGLINLTAGGLINVSERSGTLTLGNVLSTSGAVTLTTLASSAFDIVTTTGSNITGTTITLDSGRDIVLAGTNATGTTLISLLADRNITTSGFLDSDLGADSINLTATGYIEAPLLNMTANAATGNINFTAAKTRFGIGDINSTSTITGVYNFGNTLFIDVSGDITLGTLNANNTSNIAYIALTSSTGNILVQDGSSLTAQAITLSNWLNGGTVTLDNTTLTATVGDITVSSDDALAFYGTMTAADEVKLYSRTSSITLDQAGVGQESHITGNFVTIDSENTAGIHITNTNTLVLSEGNPTMTTYTDGQIIPGDTINAASTGQGIINIDGELTSVGTVRSLGTAGDITISYSASSLNLTNVTINGGTGSSGTINLTNDANGANNGTLDTASGSGAGNIVITTTNGYSITGIGTSITGSAITIQSDNNMNLSGAFSGTLTLGATNGFVQLTDSAGDLDLVSANAATSVTLTATAGSIIDNNNDALVDITALNGNVTLAANVTAGSAIGSLLNPVEVSVTGGSLSATALNDIYIESPNQVLALNTLLSSLGDIVITNSGSNNMTLDGDITALAGDVVLTTSGNLVGAGSTEQSIVGDNITLSVASGYLDAHHINVEADTSAAGVVDITVGSLSQFGIKNIAGNSLTGSLVNSGNLDITVTTGDLRLGSVDASALGLSDVYLTVGALGGDILLYSGSTLNANDIVFNTALASGSSITALDTTLTASGGITLQANGDTIVQGNLTATGALSISSQTGNIDLDTATLGSTLSAQSILVDNSANAAGTLSALNASITSLNGDITLHSGNNMTLQGTITANNDLTLRSETGNIALDTALASSALTATDMTLDAYQAGTSTNHTITIQNTGTSLLVTGANGGAATQYSDGDIIPGGTYNTTGIDTASLVIEGNVNNAGDITVLPANSNIEVSFSTSNLDLTNVTFITPSGLTATYSQLNGSVTGNAVNLDATVNEGTVTLTTAAGYTITGTGATFNAAHTVLQSGDAIAVSADFAGSLSGSAGAGNVTLTDTSANMAVGLISAVNGDITLVASAGSILDADDDLASDVTTTSGDISLTAAGVGATIGSSSNALDVSMANGASILDASADGLINIRSVNQSVRLGTLTSANSSLRVDTSAGAYDILSSGTTTLTGTSITLNAGRHVTVTGGLTGVVSGTASTGNVTLNVIGGDLDLGTVTSTVGSISLSALSGEMTDSNGASVNLVAGQSVTMDALGSVGSLSDALEANVGVNLTVNTPSLVNITLNNTMTGGVTIGNTTRSSQIQLASTSGNDIRVNDVRATGAITLNSLGDIYNTSGGGGTVLDGGNITMTAQGQIGVMPVEATLDANLADFANYVSSVPGASQGTPIRLVSTGDVVIQANGDVNLAGDITGKLDGQAQYIRLRETNDIHIGTLTATGDTDKWSIFLFSEDGSVITDNHTLITTGDSNNMVYVEAGDSLADVNSSVSLYVNLTGGLAVVIQGQVMNPDDINVFYPIVENLDSSYLDAQQLLESNFKKHWALSSFSLKDKDGGHAEISLQSDLVVAFERLLAEESTDTDKFNALSTQLVNMILSRPLQTGDTLLVTGHENKVLRKLLLSRLAYEIAEGTGLNTNEALSQAVQLLLTETWTHQDDSVVSQFLLRNNTALNALTETILKSSQMTASAP